MKNWEKALNKFIKTIENDQDIIGYMVCWSYITWNPSKHSDIDFHIFLNNKCKYKEIWHKVIDWFLIEYFKNTISTHKKYLKQDFQQRSTYDAHMLYTGKILLDKTGEILKLHKLAHKYLLKSFKKNNKDTELTKYFIRDKLDNLLNIYERNWIEFDFEFYNNLYRLFEKYTDFLWYHQIPSYKLLRFLTNTSDQKKYLIKDFPDKIFKNFMIKAFNQNSSINKINIYKKITNHVLNKMWWFKINWFKYRSNI